MTPRPDDFGDLDALLRSAAAQDRPPSDLAERTRQLVTDAARRQRRRRSILATLVAGGSLAAAASVALLLVPAGPTPVPAPGGRAMPPEVASGDARMQLAANIHPARMRGGDASPGAELLDAGDDIPITLASTDPSITIVWLLPGPATDQPETLPQ